MVVTRLARELKQYSLPIRDFSDESALIRCSLLLPQESEDMRSDSLGVQLRKTERELKQHKMVAQQQLHELTAKELEVAKTTHDLSRGVPAIQEQGELELAPPILPQGQGELELAPPILLKGRVSWRWPRPSSLKGRVSWR